MISRRDAETQRGSSWHNRPAYPHAICPLAEQPLGLLHPLNLVRAFAPSRETNSSLRLCVSARTKMTING